MPRINLLPWRDEERKERKLKFLRGDRRRSDRRVSHGLRRLPDDGLDGQRAGSPQRDPQRAKSPSSTSRSRRSTASRRTRRASSRAWKSSRSCSARVPRSCTSSTKSRSSCPTASISPAITQNGRRLKFEGVAQSSTRVSTFMRNIDTNRLPQEARARRRREQEGTTSRVRRSSCGRIRPALRRRLRPIPPSPSGASRREAEHEHSRRPQVTRSERSWPLAASGPRRRRGWCASCS